MMGIDLGTTALKIGVFDANTGAVRGCAVEQLPVAVLKDGGREMVARHIDRAIGHCVGALRKTLGDSLKRVCGVGVAAQGGSSIIADRASGRALTPMYLWNDARGCAYADRVSDRFPRDYWRRLALRDFPPAGLARMLWLKAQRPELFNAAHIHIGAGEYLYFKLTGEWRQDAGHAIQIGAYDAVNCRLEREPLGLLKASLSFLAPLRRGHETSSLVTTGARMLGVPEGTPVAGPYIDQEAGYQSVCARFPQALQASLGTAWVGNFSLAKGLSGKSPTQLILPAPCGGGRLVVQPLLTGNAGWDWALGSFADPDRDAAFDRASRIFRERLLPADGLFAVPWFTQQNGLFEDAHGSGVFWGLRPDTSRDDFVRAVGSGMTFEFARVFERVRREGVIDRVVLGGGASKASYFRALFAALFSPLPVYRQVDEDLAAARGALYAFGEGASSGRLERVPAPNARALAQITRAFDRYKAVYGRCFGLDPRGEPFKVVRSSS